MLIFLELGGGADTDPHPPGTAIPNAGPARPPVAELSGDRGANLPSCHSPGADWPVPRALRHRAVRGPRSVATRRHGAGSACTSPFEHLARRSARWSVRRAPHFEHIYATDHGNPRRVESRRGAHRSLAAVGHAPKPPGAGVRSRAPSAAVAVIACGHWAGCPAPGRALLAGPSRCARGAAKRSCSSVGG